MNRLDWGGTVFVDFAKGGPYIQDGTVLEIELN
jgi:hypothetical protein